MLIIHTGNSVEMFDLLSSMLISVKWLLLSIGFSNLILSYWPPFCFSILWNFLRTEELPKTCLPFMKVETINQTIVWNWVACMNAISNTQLASKEFWLIHQKEKAFEVLKWRILGLRQYKSFQWRRIEMLQLRLPWGFLLEFYKGKLFLSLI
jgi:hypothetical protein